MENALAQAVFQFEAHSGKGIVRKFEQVAFSLNQNKVFGQAMAKLQKMPEKV